MNLKRSLATLAAVLMTSAALFSAVRSDVADAVMKGDKAALRALIQQKSDVNVPQADGATALHWAAYKNDLESADLLLRAGADVKAMNRAGVTPLYLASLNGGDAMIEKLLAAGADVNGRGPNGETSLMLAAHNGNPAAIKILISHKADVNAKEPVRQTSALMWAIEQEHPAAVKLLVENGADIKAQSRIDANNRRARISSTPATPAATGARGAAPGAAPAAVAPAAAAAVPAGDDDQDEAPVRQPAASGGLTPLVFAARQGDVESTKILLAAGADVNQQTAYGWTALLTATQNRHYTLALYLLDHGADVNLANAGGWTPLYLATDNRNIEGGDYPTRTPDIDHFEFIKKLLDKGANVNARAIDSTETRTVFTNQWLNEDGATPFLRAAQSGDVKLMRLLLSKGADPLIATKKNVTALAVASGIGWVEGITHESSPEESLEAVKMCLELGIDPNAVDADGRRAIHGAAHKGRNEVVQLLVDHGAKLDVRDKGSRDTRAGPLVGHGWLPLDWSEGLVRVGVQSAIPHPETAALLRKLMAQQGLDVPPPGRNSTYSICLVEVCKAPE
jgi:ankyrin repeat protein